MELLQALATVTLVHLLAAASPGPDFVMVTQKSLTQGRSAGLWISLGIALGISVHLIYSIAGLAALITNSTWAFTSMKVAAAAYLLYLGWQGLRSRAQATEVEVQAVASEAWHFLVGKGFLCNALNPKAPLYFLSLFTVVLSVDMPLAELMLIGVWIMLLQFIWFAIVSTILSSALVRRRFLRISHWIDRVMGGLLVLLGVKVLLSRL